ncbi:MAG: hypothetical protein JW910_15295 [Anaerolineae bacterium]|nr:hypothetical protein [Anaerolineae bacterium]
MDDAEREQLARRLSALSLKEARSEIRRLDSKADLKYYRNSRWDEYHTLFVLPDKGLSITLVEKIDHKALDKRDYSGPPDRKRLETDYRFVEARVAPLDRRTPR